jgi:hypothetical protein
MGSLVSAAPISNAMGRDYGGLEPRLVAVNGAPSVIQKERSSNGRERAMLRLVKVCTAAALTPLLIATAPPPDPEAEIIEIIGKAPEQVRREASDYVRQLGVAMGETPAARWADPICPRAIGLDETKSALVVERVRSVAQSVGAKVAKDKCQPNLLVVFTDDAPGVVQAITRKVPLEVSGDERAQLEKGDAPIRWWYNSELRGRDGRAAGESMPWNVLRVTSTSPGGGEFSGAMPSNDRSKSLTMPGNSIVSTQVMRAISHATIVVDVKRATGKPLSSIVDYAALVGLAEVRLGASAPSSILGLFGTGRNHGELTMTDLAFLKGLYAMHMDRRAEQHRRVLIGKIIQERVAR